MSHRYSASLIQGVGTVLLPASSLYCGANLDKRLFEVHVQNTTAVACLYNLVRLDTAGTKPAAIADNPYEPGGPTAEAGVSNTHTVGPTLDEMIERLVFGAAVGAGVILTFGDKGILIPKGVANGIGIILASGTGQVLNATWVWEE